MIRVILLALLLGACSTPHLPDPRVEVSPPPPVLMEAPRKMETIPQ